MNKGALRPSNGSSSPTRNQTSIRGSSGINCSLRWTGALWPVKEDDKTQVMFKVEKTNYPPHFEPLILQRDFEHGGILKLAPKVEVINGHTVDTAPSKDHNCTRDSSHSDQYG